jgi:hypothetical protein
MNTVRLAQARRLWTGNPYVHPQTARENMRRWVASVRWLDEKWVLRQNVAKKEIK